MSTRQEIKRLRGHKLVRQDKHFGYWWYGTEVINIALVNERSGNWKLTIDFLLAEIRIKVEGDTEKMVRREFASILSSLKAGIAVL